MTIDDVGNLFPERLQFGGHRSLRGAQLQPQRD